MDFIAMRNCFVGQVRIDCENCIRNFSNMVSAVVICSSPNSKRLARSKPIINPASICPLNSIRTAVVYRDTANSFIHHI